MNYCTIGDVQLVIKTFAGDIGDNNLGQSTIDPGTITTLITQASAMTVMDFQPRYVISVINAYSPDFPDAIRQLTALRTARLVYARLGTVSVDRNRELRGLFSDEIAMWRRVIQSGSVIDLAGLQVPSITGPTSYTPAYTSKIDEAYPDGLSRYY